MNKYRIKIFIGSLCVILIGINSYYAGYYNGYDIGAEKGVNAAFDTVKQILREQLNEKKTATKLVIVNQDTVSYVLSSKTVIPE